MAEEGDGGERTEAATPRRLQKAREEGQAPLSREVATFAVLAVTALVLAMAGPGLARALAEKLAILLERAHEADPVAALRLAALAGLVAAAPFAIAAVLAGSAAVLWQTGFLMNAKALHPDLSRISPLAGCRRLFGLSTLVETGKAVLKALATAGALLAVMWGALPSLRMAAFWTAAGLADRTARLLVQMLMVTAGLQGLVALADVVRARLKYARDLRMSREEIRRELRESEGDPHIKARFRQLRMQRARRRMMTAVPKATVVVTNPTHYAVALAYEQAKGGAPKVIAKGVDELAARIRQVAEDNRVPLVANPPLARALFRVELDAEIPAEYFQAVAEIIGYVWRLSGRNARARRPQGR